jgi:hypothetical protein
MYSLALLALGLEAAASFVPAVRMERRGAYAGGGWGLSTTATGQSGCPARTTWEDAGGWSNINICCPTGFTQQNYGDHNSALICCPSGTTPSVYIYEP